MHRCLFPILALCLTILPGCASQGSFPSLAKRPFESAPTAPQPAPPAPPASDPALRQRIEGHLKSAQAASVLFDRDAAAVQSAVAASGPRGSESWINAELMVSRLETRLAPARDALSGLDDERRLMLAGAHPDDLAFLESSIAAAERIDARQSEQVQQLLGRLNRR